MVDRQVIRSGAYAETCLAIERVHATGPPQRALTSDAVGPAPATQIPRVSPFDHAVWGGLEGHTEAAWMGRTLAGDWPETPSHDSQVLEPVWPQPRRPQRAQRARDG
jgi:hypothetical protein